MDEESTRTRRTSVRDDQMDDGLSALSASRADQGDGGTGTQRPLLRSQTRAEHTRRTPDAQPTTGPYSMRGPLLDQAYTRARRVLAQPVQRRRKAGTQDREL